MISWEPVVPGSTMRIRFVGSCARIAPELGAGGSFEGIQRRYLDRFTFPTPGGSVDGC